MTPSKLIICFNYDNKKITWNSAWVFDSLFLLLVWSACFDLGDFVLTSYGVFHSYGLGAAVISNDLERCDRISKVRLGLYLKEQRNHRAQKITKTIS